jgi:hypothetical protein
LNNEQLDVTEHHFFNIFETSQSSAFLFSVKRWTEMIQLCSLSAGLFLSFNQGGAGLFYLCFIESR